MESNCSCMGTRASPWASVDRGEEGGEGEGGGVCSMTEPMPVVGEGDINDDDDDDDDDDSGEDSNDDVSNGDRDGVKNRSETMIVK